jgi:hypothetical protein
MAAAGEIGKRLGIDNHWERQGRPPLAFPTSSQIHNDLMVWVNPQVVGSPFMTLTLALSHGERELEGWLGSPRPTGEGSGVRACENLANRFCPSIRGETA